MTVKNLLDKFDVLYMKLKLERSTIDGYRCNISHINDSLGDFEVDELTLSDLDKLTEDLIFAGLNNTSIRYVYRTFGKALNFGIGRGFVEKNIVSSYDLPKPTKIEYITLSFEEVSRLLRYLTNEKSDIFVPVLFGCLYGLRRGECLGLKSYDFSENIVSIRRTAQFKNGEWIISDCKTDKSRRDILISDLHLKMISEYNEQRPKNKEGFVVRDKEGKHITQNILQSLFKDALTACDLPNIRFHDLRHTYATLMLRKGVNPKVVSSVLGHADVGVTLDIYSHADVSMQAVCVDLMNENVKIKE